MGNWHHNNELGKTMLVFEENNESCEMDTVTLNMLINNKISGLIPCSFSQIDEVKYIKFNVTSKIEFKEFLERETTFDIVADLFVNMCGSFNQMHKYMIDGESVFLDSDMMYIDISVPEAQFIINPILAQQNPADFKRFFRDIVVRLKLNAQDSQYVGAILALLNDKSFSLDNFSQGLLQLKANRFKQSQEVGQSFPKVVQQSAVKNNFVQPRQENQKARLDISSEIVKSEIPVFAAEDKNINEPQKENPGQVDSGGRLRGIFSGFSKKPKISEKSSGVQKKAKSKPALMGEFAVPGQDVNIVENMNASPQAPSKAASRSINQNAGDSEYVAPVAKASEDEDVTVMIGGYSDNCLPKLIRTSTAEVIEIDKDTFNLGRDPKALLDYVINDGRISRRHASIIYKNGSYYLADRGSRNHTFLNGRMLGENEEAVINSGDVIRLASEEFTFEL